MTKLAGIQFYEWILKNNYWNKVLICAFIHDEIVVECPKDIDELVSYNLKKSMENAGSVFCKKIPIIAEPEISYFWNH